MKKKLLQNKEILMTSNSKKIGSGWSKVKNWIVGLTSVLVVIPALIYSGFDIYEIWQEIPQTKSEKSNKELYQKYFGKQPMQVIPVPIKKGDATYQVQFSIYKEGDIFVEYGKMTQWFPFPIISALNKYDFSPISSAYASDKKIAQPAGKYILRDKIDGGLLIRNKIYESGAQIQQSINIRTGKIIDSKVIKKGNFENQEIKSVSPFAVIDLDKINSEQTNSSKAKQCKTFNGDCALLQNTPKNELCFCITPSGKIPGISE